MESIAYVTTYGHAGILVSGCCDTRVDFGIVFNIQATTKIVIDYLYIRIDIAGDVQLLLWVRSPVLSRIS